MPDNKRILIIDDAATVRMYHRSILETSGYQVDEAVNGLEAMEKILGNKPYDLYLVDINMPKLDGYGFLKELRIQDIPQAPAIMISTEAQEKDRISAFEAGANIYMVKPIDPDILTAYCSILLSDGDEK